MTEQEKQEHKKRIALNRLLKIIDGEITVEHPKRMITITNASIYILDKNDKHYDVEDAQTINIDVNFELGKIIIYGFDSKGEPYHYSTNIKECSFTNYNKFPNADLRIFSDEDEWICVIRGNNNSTIDIDQNFYDISNS